MSIGKNIQRLRKEKGLTQDQLAEKSSITRTALGNYERDLRIPNIEIANKIAESLDVSVDEIMGNNNKEEIYKYVEDYIQNLMKDTLSEETIDILKEYSSLNIHDLDESDYEHIKYKNYFNDLAKEDQNKRLYLESINVNLGSLDLESLKIIDALIVKLKNDK